MPPAGVIAWMASPRNVMREAGQGAMRCDERIGIAKVADGSACARRARSVGCQSSVSVSAS